jgi:hypothetical protein
MSAAKIARKAYRTSPEDVVKLAGRATAAPNLPANLLSYVEIDALLERFSP